jgi:ABC-2 type transport system ATP-binding protein
MPDIVLQTEHLCKRYGELVAVKDLSLEVYAGEVFGLLGPNGAGKTTSINMMCGLLRPDGGQVCVHGAPVRSGEAGVRAQVGVCPQEIVVWKQLTCIEQLQFTGEMYGIDGRVARKQGERLLEELGLSDKRDRQARTLSGGMQRRLNLALALVHDPGIVVLDEPEAGLDPQSRIKVREYIRSLARRKTVILTTHNMDEAERVADRVGIIDHGELLVLDRPEALKRSMGDGDVLEIHLKGQDSQAASASSERALRELASLPVQVITGPGDDSIALRGLDVVAMLPAILEALACAGIEFGEVRLRTNTLEDVFIQLTGRRLRE